jgi:hypothetical protein
MKKKESFRAEKDTTAVSENLTVEDTMKFLAKVFSEKQKRDVISLKNRTYTCSVDEITVLTALEEHPTKLKDAISVLSKHF